MARPLRIEYPGAQDHVMSRGNREKDIFLTDKGCQVFVDGLVDSCETYRIKLIAYVLMSNHFLLLAQTPQANLREFNRHFLVTYTVRFKSQMALELNNRYSACRQKEIGAIFGVDYSTVSQSRARFKIKLKSRRKLKKLFHRIPVLINEFSNSKI